MTKSPFKGDEAEHKLSFVPASHSTEVGRTLPYNPRLRDGYDPSEEPCEIVVGKHTTPRRRTGEYLLVHHSIGDYEGQLAGFVKFESPSLCEIKPEKVCDTHKLVCLGLPDDKIRL